MDFVNLLGGERKKLADQEKMSSDTLKQKNEAMTLLFKEIETTKEKYTKQIEFNNILKNNHGSQEQTLNRILQQKSAESTEFQKELRSTQESLSKQI